MTLNPSEIYLHGCDLYLLEKWDSNVTSPDDEQMMQIFKRFVKLPIAERQVYTQQLKDRGLRTAANLSQQEQDILKRARPDEERRNFESRIMLQTYYGPGSEEAMASILEDPVFEVSIEVIANASRYNFGRDWQRVFHRIPQLLDVWPEYEAQVAEERDGAIQLEQDMRSQLESDDDSLPDDTDDVARIYSSYHLQKRIGFICVLDETTLGENWRDIDKLSEEEKAEAAEADKADSTTNSWMYGGGLGQRFRPPAPRRGPYWEERCLQRKFLSGWFDADGELVRWNWLTANEVSMELGCISCGMFDDHDIWMKADMDFEALPDASLEDGATAESSEAEE